MRDNIGAECGRRSSFERRVRRDRLRGGTYAGRLPWTWRGAAYPVQGSQASRIFGKDDRNCISTSSNHGLAERSNTRTIATTTLCWANYEGNRIHQDVALRDILDILLKAGRPQGLSYEASNSPRPCAMGVGDVQGNQIARGQGANTGRDRFRLPNFRSRIPGDGRAKRIETILAGSGSGRGRTSFAAPMRLGRSAGIVAGGRRDRAWAKLKSRPRVARAIYATVRQCGRAVADSGVSRP